MKLAGRDISDLSLEQLTASLKAMQAAGAKRQEASRHPKFNDSFRGKKPLRFPPNNHVFEKLIIAITEEIRKKKNV